VNEQNKNFSVQLSPNRTDRQTQTYTAERITKPYSRVTTRQNIRGHSLQSIVSLANGGARNFQFLGRGYSPGGLGDGSPPAGVQGQRPGRGSWAQTLKQCADCLLHLDCGNDHNSKISHKLPPDSWPVCFTGVGG